MTSRPLDPPPFGTGNGWGATGKRKVGHMLHDTPHSRHVLDHAFWPSTKCFPLSISIIPCLQAGAPGTRSLALLNAVIITHEQESTLYTPHTVHQCSQHSKAPNHRLIPMYISNSACTYAVRLITQAARRQCFKGTFQRKALHRLAHTLRPPFLGGKRSNRITSMGATW